MIGAITGVGRVAEECEIPFEIFGIERKHVHELSVVFYRLFVRAYSSIRLETSKRRESYTAFSCVKDCVHEVDTVFVRRFSFVPKESKNFGVHQVCKLVRKTINVFLLTAKSPIFEGDSLMNCWRHECRAEPNASADGVANAVPARGIDFEERGASLFPFAKLSPYRSAECGGAFETFDEFCAEKLWIPFCKVGG